MKKRNHVIIGVALALAMLFSIMAMGNLQAKDYGLLYSGEDQAFHDAKIDIPEPNTPLDYAQISMKADNAGISGIEQPAAGFIIKGPGGVQTHNNVNDQGIRARPVDFIKVSSSADLDKFSIVDTSKFGSDAKETMYDYQMFLYSPEDQTGSYLDLSQCVWSYPGTTSPEFVQSNWSGVQIQFKTGLETLKSRVEADQKTYRLICYLAVSKGYYAPPGGGDGFRFWNANGNHLCWADPRPERPEMPNGGLIYYVYGGVEMSAGRTDLMTTGFRFEKYQPEYMVTRDWELDPASHYYVQKNRFEIGYTFWNSSATAQSAVPYRIIACRQGSTCEGQVIKEGVVDIPAGGATPYQTLKIDYDALKLGAEYQNAPCVAVIIDPDNGLPEDDEDNNIARFKPGDLKFSLSVSAWSPPEGFPVHSTGYGTITVQRDDTLPDEFEAVLSWRVCDQEVQSKALHITAGQGVKDSITVYHYSDVRGYVPFTAWIKWNDGSGEQSQDTTALIHFWDTDVPWQSPDGEYTNDLIVDIGSS